MKFREHMTMHMNGGSKFSELHYRVSGDGQELPITHHRRTDGSPKYLITADVFSCKKCGSDFDCLATRRVGLMAWLLEHSACAT